MVSIFQEPETLLGSAQMHFAYIFLLFLAACGNDKSEPKLPTPVHLISYGNDAFAKARERILNQASETLWFSSVEIYQPEKISDFFKTHSDFFANNPRFGGYLIWKPYIILQKLKEIYDNDILVYSDSGTVINKNGYLRFQSYVNLLFNSDKSILGFLHPSDNELAANEKGFYEERHWNKADLLAHLSLLNDNKILYSVQAIGGLIFLKKNSESIAFVEEWLRLALADNYHYIDDSPSVIANRSDYVEHRHDQSIYSLLCKIKGCMLIPYDGYSRKEIAENDPQPFFFLRKRD